MSVTTIYQTTLHLLCSISTGLTFAGADEEVAVWSDSTEGQVDHRPGVTGAGERSLSHRHGPAVAAAAAAAPGVEGGS